jgi:hypothetical protein
MARKKQQPEGSVMDSDALHLARQSKVLAGKKAQKLDESGIEYLQRLPDFVPADKVLVHNQVRATGRLGLRGFRVWLSSPDPAKLEVCPCGWAPELGQHFREPQYLRG